MTGFDSQNLERDKFMKSFVTGAFTALAIGVGAQSVAAAGLDVTLVDPTIEASQAEVFYSVIGGTQGDISIFSAPVTGLTGVLFGMPGTVDLGIQYDLAAPDLTVTGGFSVYDDTFAPVLSGDVVKIGYGEDMIELLFDTLQGSAAASFSSQALMRIVFAVALDPTVDGDNPLDGLVDFGDYDVSVTISNVATSEVPVPAGLPLVLTSAAALAWVGRRKRS